VDEAQIYARLKSIFEDVFGYESIELTPELTAEDVDGWDSISHFRLVLTVERVFKVKFSPTEIGTFETVGALVALIRSHAER